ncbi:MAG TPA: aminotransferase class V-fold PLP-dependent enzyme [Paracoccaceae bacterium]|nr:aminotransferase class V-fold PLP-dependent enzyme [Paracoccaceae bacterium]
MTGYLGRRIYLDWNATAPLRPAARAAMLAAMEVVGNPSSVHAEGRSAKAILNRGREQVAGLLGCRLEELVFTCGATEAVNQVLAQEWERLVLSAFEHDCVQKGAEASGRPMKVVTEAEEARRAALAPAGSAGDGGRTLIAWMAACGETGRVMEVDAAIAAEAGAPGRVAVLSDQTQAAGRLAAGGRRPSYAALSAHKLGGPKGVGALILREGAALAPLLRGGGQERGRRAGTENVIGIAGFGAAAEAAKRDLEAGIWEGVERLRDRLEERLADAAPDLIILGREVPRLPNTSCFAVRGWKGETQVMQMDLAGFAVSAGAACSSGKVGPSRVLKAMGCDDLTASSAIRVSLGPTTTEAEVMAFADAWIELLGRFRRRAA